MMTSGSLPLPYLSITSLYFDWSMMGIDTPPVDCVVLEARLALVIETFNIF